LRNFDFANLPVIVNVQKLDIAPPIDERRDDSLDLVICFGHDFQRSHTDFKSRRLVEDELVYVFDKRVTPPQLRPNLRSIEHRHVLSPHKTFDTHSVDHKRQLIAQPASYRAALKMITGTDLILTLPRRIQTLLANDAVFSHCEASKGLPGFILDMQWSEASDQDSANTWLREQVVKSLRRTGFALHP